MPPCEDIAHGRPRTPASSLTDRFFLLATIIRIRVKEFDRIQNPLRRNDWKRFWWNISLQFNASSCIKLQTMVWIGPDGISGAWLHVPSLAVADLRKTTTSLAFIVPLYTLTVHIQRPLPIISCWARVPWISRWRPCVYPMIVLTTNAGSGRGINEKVPRYHSHFHRR